MTKSKRIKELEEKVKELEKRNDLFDFLCKYNKDEILFEREHFMFYSETKVKYLYNGELKEHYLCMEDNYDNEVISNDKDCAILRSWFRYFKLDKITNTVMDITDIYKPKTETKKPSTKTTKTTKKK